MNSVVNTSELRDAYNTTLPRLTEYHTEIGQNTRLFAAYKKIAATKDFEALDRAKKKAIENAIRDFKLSGIDLEQDKQERFTQISKRLSELSSKFSDNVLDATMAWSKVITDKAELAGLPESSLGLAKQMAEQREENGYLFTLDFPSYQPVMTYCENEALRKEMYEAYSTRASSLGPHGGQWDNSQIILELLALRKERAELLGFDSYAEYSLATKMAQNTDQVTQFLREMAEKSRPAAEVEYSEICRFASEKFNAESVNAWDVNFYAEKLKEDKFNISAEELRPYFPAPTVIKGMFEVVKRLFDIEVEENGDIETWHDQVTTYDVKKNNEVIARFYLDLYARENKRGGAWMDDCRVRRIKMDGSVQLPVAYLTCNFTAPVGDEPGLLRHDEVVTLFHEFGHGLHHMMTSICCAAVSGIN